MKFYLFLLIVFFYGCGNTVTPTPNTTTNNNNNSSGGNNSSNNGNNYTSTAACGPYISNSIGGSSGSSQPLYDIPSNINTFTASDTILPMNLCTVPNASSLEDTIYYIPITGSDTIFISSNPLGLSLISSSTAQDSVINNDHIEYLGNMQKGFGSTGTQENYFILSNLNLGYSLSQTDLQNFYYSYTTNICLSDTLFSNNLGNFLGKQGYIAFRLADSQGYFYGWLRVSLSPNYYLQVYQVTYSTTVNTPISIGMYQ